MKRTRLNFALLAIAAGLGVAVFFAQKKDEKGPPLTSLSAQAIVHIAIEHPNAPAITLEKQLGLWKLTAPVQTDADALELGAVIALATTEIKSTLATLATLDAAQVKLADLGLAPPQYSITLNGQKIEFGGVEPLQYRRYLRMGEKIVLVNDPPSTALDADYSDLVVKNLLPAGAQVTQIKLPGMTLTDPKTIAAWKSARAMWNAAQDGEASGDEVTVQLADHALKFIVAERDPQLVLVRPDLKLRYTLSKALADELLKPPEEKKLAPAQPTSAAPMAKPSSPPGSHPPR